jgi:hypothetical protein
MRFAKRFWALGMAVMITALCIGQAHAQPTLPNTIISTTRQLTQSQQQQVDEYVSYYASTLAQADSRKVVTDARRLLIEPLRRPGATPIFQDAYSTIAAPQLSPAVGHDDPFVRHNAMVVVTELTAGSGVPLISQAIGDSDLAVRYDAAKAASVATASPVQVMGAIEQEELAGALVPAMKNEQSLVILAELYQALGGMINADARQALLGRLETRAQEQADNLNIDAMLAELKGLLRFNRQLWVMAIRAQKADDPARLDEILQEVKASARISALYLQLISAAISGGIVSDNDYPEMVQAVRLLEENLNFAVRRFSPDADPGPALFEPLDGGRVAEFRLNVGEWIGSDAKPGHLTSSSIAIPAERLRFSS